MAAFDDSSISQGDMKSFKDASLIVQLAIGRQIDRVFANSGAVYNAKADFGHSKATVKNMKFQLALLSKFMLPYTHKEMPQEVISLMQRLKDTKVSNYEDVDKYSDTISDLFGEIVCNLGYVKLLPPVKKTFESGTD